MLRKIDTPNCEAFLVRFRLSPPAFTPDPRRAPSVLAVWTALAAEEWDAAYTLASASLKKHEIRTSEEQAGMLAGQAAAALWSGRVEGARIAAARSLALFPRQWLAHRVQVEVSALRRDYGACYDELHGLERYPETAAWDVPVDARELEVAQASYSWKLGQWDRVAEHLLAAFPDGLDTMPDHLREDWFRLSLYRDRPDEASRAAASLLAERPVERMDELLQTIVQGGWTGHALPLYRHIYRERPEHELVRRRLVALCIKEGELDEARRITATSALRSAA